MSSDTLCPDPVRIRQFVVGDLPEAEVDAICEHVTSCPACTMILRNLPHVSTLLDDVSARPDAWAPDADDREAIEELIERLKALSSSVEPQVGADSACAAGDGRPASAHDFATDIRSDINLEELARPLLGPSSSAGDLGSFESYRVLGVLGAGGMGVVFEAEDLRLGRRVAVKAMQPSLLGRAEHKLRFLREARAAASIDHDNIVPIHHVGEDCGVPFFVMPLLKGESLETRLRRAGRLSIAGTVSIGRQIASGIAAAHERGLVHRDIKPANIWLERREQQLPRVRILDFGLARIEDDDSQLTNSGSVAGTPAFMAPEQARGERANARSDIFSIGCVLYCLLTGKPPFTGRNSAAMMFAVIHHQPEPLDGLQPAVPEALATLLMQLLQKDPAQRPKSARDVAEALQAIEQEISRGEPVDAGAAGQHADKPIAQPLSAGNGAAALDTNRVRLIKAAGTQPDSRRTVLTAIVLMAIGALCALIWIMRVETPHGTVVLEMDPQQAAGAEVSVDEQRRIMLKLPKDDEPITIDVDSGTHQLKVEKPGFKIFTREFSMVEGDWNDSGFDLSRRTHPGGPMSRRTCPRRPNGPQSQPESDALRGSQTMLLFRTGAASRTGGRVPPMADRNASASRRHLRRRVGA
ncbi:MAG: serine/threonine-protein kinase [Planctomycetaceae bacterium]